MNKLPALFGRRPEKKEETHQPKRDLNRIKTRPRAFTPTPPSQEGAEPLSRKTIPFPFSTDLNSDPDSARPPRTTLTRTKIHSYLDNGNESTQSRKTQQFPSVNDQSPQQILENMLSGSTEPAIFDASADQTEEDVAFDRSSIQIPVPRQAFPTMLHLEESVTPPVIINTKPQAAPTETISSQKSGKPISQIIKERKRLILSILTGVAIGMAGNVAYYYYHQNQHLPANIDKIGE